MEKKSYTITKDNIASIALLYNYVTNNEIQLSSHKIDKYFSDIASEFLHHRNRFNDIEFIFSSNTVNYKDFKKQNVFMPESEYLMYNYLNRNKDLKKDNLVNLTERDLIGISIDDSGKYVINDIESVIASFNSQPLEVIDATLNSANLNTIDVIQSRLNIEKKEKKYNWYEDICTMNEERAKNVTIQCLKDYGFKNIKISNCNYLGMKPDHTFRVYYTATKELMNSNIHFYLKEPGNYR